MEDCEFDPRSLCSMLKESLTRSEANFDGFPSMKAIFNLMDNNYLDLHLLLFMLIIPVIRIILIVCMLPIYQSYIY